MKTLSITPAFCDSLIPIELTSPYDSKGGGYRLSKVDEKVNGILF